MKYKGTAHRKSYNTYLKLLKRIQNNEWPNYNFINSIYINDKTKIEIECQLHGLFYIRTQHLRRPT